MLAWTLKFCVLILLVVTVGGQWALLQSIAWTGMLIDYSRNVSMSDAICKTFDGKHPCCLCKAIATGRKSEQKKHSSLNSQKLEFPPSVADWVLNPPRQFPLVACADLVAKAVLLKPPTPPPRSSIVEF